MSSGMSKAQIFGKLLVYMITIYASTYHDNVRVIGVAPELKAYP